MRKKFDKDIDREWVVYKITNPIGQIYIGCTCNFKERLSHYRNVNCVKQKLIYASLVQYGYAQHTVEIIDKFVSNYQYAQGKELFWVKSNLSNATKWPEYNGMNISAGGQGALGVKASEKKLLMLRSRKGHIKSEETRRLIGIGNKGKISPFRGVPMTPEQRKAHGESQIICRGKPVIVYDLNMNLIGEYGAVKLAARELNVDSKNVFAILAGRIKTPKKYIYKYKQ